MRDLLEIDDPAAYVASQAGEPVANLTELEAESLAAESDPALSNITPGSDEAEKVKQALIKEGLWSQYLEVGIGPDAEVFSKAQILSGVGWGAPVGLHPKSVWNNPEPEIVLAVNSKGAIQGATIGNDVNLRDFEGRSALLLSKGKDNNASASIGPFIRLFDEQLFDGRRPLCRADNDGHGSGRVYPERPIPDVGDQPRPGGYCGANDQ